jgi:hypothetical protein
VRTSFGVACCTIRRRGRISLKMSWHFASILPESLKGSCSRVHILKDGSEYGLLLRGHPQLAAGCQKFMVGFRRRRSLNPGLVQRSRSLQETKPNKGQHQEYAENKNQD